MSDYYATVSGDGEMKGQRGSKEGGMWVHVRGHDLGVRIDVWYDEKEGMDVFEVRETSGSNEHRTGRVLARVRGLS